VRQERKKIDKSVRRKPKILKKTAKMDEIICVYGAPKAPFNGAPIAWSTAHQKVWFRAHQFCVRIF